MAKKNKKTKKEPKLISVWCRLGGFIQMTLDELKRANTDDLSNEEIASIIKRGFEVNGDSYIPSIVIEDMQHDRELPKKGLKVEDDIELGDLDPFNLKFAGDEAPAK